MIGADYPGRTAGECFCGGKIERFTADCGGKNTCTQVRKVNAALLFQREGIDAVQRAGGGLEKAYTVS